MTSKTERPSREDKIAVDIAEVQCAFAVAEVQKVTVNLRLQNTSCSFAKFAVAELGANLRCPALKIRS